MSRSGPPQGDAADHPVEDPDIDDVLTELEELETMVDSREEREQVRETMRTARHVRPQGVIGRFRDQFGPRDAGEALVGSFLFGLPVIVEDGALAVGRYIAMRPVYLVVTLLLGCVLVLGVLSAGRFEDVTADRAFGLVPVRPFAIVTIAFVMAAILMTIWGRVSWREPMVAASQTTLTGIVMSLGASLGDILPEN